MKRLLVLGGTGEAVALANTLAAEFGSIFSVITSLAGRTRSPVLPPGKVRTGGFGGAKGLEDYLRTEAIDAVVDATHPFAAQITAHAVTACAAAALPRLRLNRPAWAPVPGDDWRMVPDLSAAAAMLPHISRRAFVTVGSTELAVFRDLADLRFWARMIERPAAEDIPQNCTIVKGRGPFALEDELAFMRGHGIDVLVTKNSGGPQSAAKLAAARDLRIPVVMVARPPDPPGDIVAGVAEAVAWLRQLGR